MNILVVDDHEEVRTMIGSLLSRKGHAVVNAENGRRALELLSQGAFDLIISDIVMPEMEGVDFIMRIRQMHIPVISMSGLARETIVSEFFASLGIVGFLQKPFRYEELMQLVDNVDVGQRC